jgi:hypothetical protein
MSKPSWVETHLLEIKKLQRLLDEVPEECLVEQIDLHSKMLVYIGKLAAELSEEYKRIYILRKRVHAEAYINAAKSKAAEAEIAVIELRVQETEAFGNKERWNNAFESTKERINALKYKVRIDIEDGSSRRGA